MMPKNTTEAGRKLIAQLTALSPEQKIALIAKCLERSARIQAALIALATLNPTQTQQDKNQ